MLQETGLKVSRTSIQRYCALPLCAHCCGRADQGCSASFSSPNGPLPTQVIIDRSGPSCKASRTMPDGSRYEFPIQDLLDIATLAAAHDEHEEHPGGYSNYKVDDDAISWLDRAKGSVSIYPRTTSLCSQSLHARVERYFGKARVQQIEPGMKVLSSNPSCGGPTTNDQHVCVAQRARWSMSDTGIWVVMVQTEGIGRC